MNNIMHQVYENCWRVNMDASKRMRRLGFVCLGFIAVDLAISVLMATISPFVILAVSVCFFTAIYDFRQSNKFAREAERYKKEISFNDD